MGPIWGGIVDVAIIAQVLVLPPGSGHAAVEQCGVRSLPCEVQEAGAPPDPSGLRRDSPLIDLSHAEGEGRGPGEFSAQ